MKDVFDYLDANYSGRTVFRTSPRGHPNCRDYENYGPINPTDESYDFEPEAAKLKRTVDSARVNWWYVERGSEGWYVNEEEKSFCRLCLLLHLRLYNYYSIFRVRILTSYNPYSGRISQDTIKLSKKFPVKWSARRWF